MALCDFAVPKLLDRNNTLPAMMPRALIMHTAVDGTNTVSLHDLFNSRGVCSHFYIRQDGTLEQYVDTGRVAAAQFDANAFAISCETWDGLGSTGGSVAQPWNPAQLDTIDRLARWCNTTHGVPLVQIPTWDGAGIGWHCQFPEHWAKDGHSCPTSSRVTQMQQVVIPRLAGAKPLPPPPEDSVIGFAIYRHEAQQGRLVLIEEADGRPSRKVCDIKSLDDLAVLKKTNSPREAGDQGRLLDAFGW